MAKEIERKFLVSGDSYRRKATESHHIVLAYLSTDPEATVRVRILDDRGFLTVKGLNHGAVRSEWEYEIPHNDATAMIAQCARSKTIDKTRYIVPAAEEGLKWEVDEFHCSHQGLVVAEIELPSEDTPFSLPDFAGKEVTGDPAYYNSSLAGI